jgi:hypothetical protein
MKKVTTVPSASEPMGIVITTGTRAPVQPLVRAYVWGMWSAEPSTGGSEEQAGI